MLIAIVIIVVLVLWYVSTMNGLRQQVVKIEENESGIDVALTKRYDTLKKMVDVTRAYAKHEKETIMETISLRQGMSMKERNEAITKLNEVEQQIKFTAEAYPELRSNENYRQLQVTIADVEEHLQAARRAYNAAVSSLNQRIVTFPTSFVAKNCGITQRDFFEAESIKREDIKIDL